MFLIIIERSDRRKFNAWLRFDIIVKRQRMSIFVDSNVSYCFIVQRIVDLLKLNLQHIFDKVQLKKNKIVNVVDIIQLQWNRDEFHIIIECIILNIKNDLILNENFWQEYYLIFDYDTLSIRVTNNDEKYFLFNIKINHSHLQILDNQSSLIIKFKRRVFEKCVQKSAQFYLYIVQQIEKNTKTTWTSEKITLFHRIIDSSTLNRKLKNDLLKIFRSDLFEQFSSKWSQNHSIDIKNARSINKSFYELSYKQLTEQII